MNASHALQFWKGLFTAACVTGILGLTALTAHAGNDANGEADDLVLVDDDGELDDAGANGEDAADAKPMPEAFPRVDLVPNSVPQYGAVKLDPWGMNILYFVFDGNVENGYNRMYVWVPEGREYARPTALNARHEHTFPTITWRTEKDDEVAETAYTFRAIRQTGRTGGRDARTSIDYETGKTVTRSAVSSRPYTNISFRYNLTYTRDRSPRGGPNLLRVNIPAPSHDHSRRSISLSTNFTEVIPQAAWNNIHFRWSVDRQYGAEQNNAVLRFSGRPQHGSGSNRRHVSFDAIPQGFFDINLRISPYQKAPAFTKTIPMIDLANNGLTVDIPFGWYRAAYDAETHPWIGGRQVSQGTGLMALGRRQPASTSLVSGDRSPATQLRGPPPSQLRGGPGSR